MTIVIPGLLLVGYVPGALLFRAPVAGRATRAALRAEERTFWAVIISLVWSTFAALALAALGHYSLNNLLGVNVAVSAVMAVAWHRRLAYDTPAPRPGWSVLAPVVPLAIGAWLFFPSSEYVIGGKDPGIYVNQGIQMAQRGTLHVPDGTLAALPERFRDQFLLGGTAGGLNEGLRFMGFFVTNRERGDVVGQFPQGFPAWIAVGYGFDGLTGARHATGAWALVGLFAVCLLWTRLLGPLTASAGTALLALNVAQVWFAKYPSSEVMQQALLAAALLALARAYRDGDRFFDIVAAATLGLLMFVRFDSILILAAVAGGFVLLAADGRRPSTAFLVTLGLILAVAVPYWAGPLRSYVLIPFLLLGGATRIAAMPLVAAGAVALVLACHTHKPAWCARARRALPWAAAALVAALSLYAYVFREPGGRLALHDAHAMRTLGWYFTDAGVALAVAGLCYVILRRFWQDPVTLSAMTAVSAFILYKVRIVPDHFWQARRYLPVVLPLLCVMAAAAATGLWNTAAGPGGLVFRRFRVPARIAGAAFAVACGAYLGWASWSASSVIANHVEYAGTIPGLERLAGRFGDRDLVVVESRGSSDAHVLATPLAYIYARHVLLLNSPRPDPVPFADFLSWAASTYDHVYFLADGGTALAMPRVDVRPVASESIETPEYESLRNEYPRQARVKKFHLSLFQLVPVTEGAARAVTDIDIGGPDDVWVLRIHGKERQGPVSYRWTRNVSYLNILGIPAGSAHVTLWLSNGGRPKAAGTATVKVLFNGTTLGEIVVGDGFRPYDLAIPPEAAAAAATRKDASVLRLESTVWNPRKILGVPDDRQLGVMLDRVRIQ